MKLIKKEVLDTPLYLDKGKKIIAKDRNNKLDLTVRKYFLEMLDMPNQKEPLTRDKLKAFNAVEDALNKKILSLTITTLRFSSITLTLLASLIALLTRPSLTHLIMQSLTQLKIKGGYLAKEYLTGNKDCSSYLKISVRTFLSLKKRFPNLKIIKTGVLRSSRVITTKEWLDEWIEKMGDK